jgi:hypothetical protein
MNLWKTLAAITVAVLMSGTARAGGWESWLGEKSEKHKEKQSERAERESDLYEEGRSTTRSGTRRCAPSASAPR